MYLHGKMENKYIFWSFTELKSLIHNWNITSSIKNGTDCTRYKNKFKYWNTDFYEIYFTSPPLHYKNCFIWCPVCFINYFTSVLAQSAAFLHCATLFQSYEFDTCVMMIMMMTMMTTINNNTSVWLGRNWKGNWGCAWRRSVWIYKMKRNWNANGMLRITSKRILDIDRNCVHVS